MIITKSLLNYGRGSDIYRWKRLYSYSQPCHLSPQEGITDHIFYKKINRMQDESNM